MASLPEQNLWQVFKHTQDSVSRETLILRYVPLVKYVAGRLAVSLPKHVEVDDLYSYGIFGLMDAIEKFDPARGVKFETYAMARIRGAILDGLRALDWVPASVRQKRKELEQAFALLEMRLGRAASDREVAEYLNLTPSQYDARVAEVGGAALLSLEEAWFGAEDGDGRVRTAETIADQNARDPVKELQDQETQRLLAEAIERLPERERTVVALYYYEGLTIREIGEVLGVTPSRVSQLHTKAILRLRGRLGRFRDDLLGI
ncbi:MAG: FliA/WhiG family RNA polymerase sigma factor [Bacillota bacterium]